LQSRGLYQLTLEDGDTTELYHWAPIVLDRLKAVPGLIDVSSDLQIATTQARIDIDRDRADALGVTPQQIEATLYLGPVP
jgi:multidrug efflux pump subunit AcrB